MAEEENKPTENADKAETPSEASQDSTESSAGPTDYIVVAEDSAPNRNILVHLLKRFGFGVFECEDGQKAWEALKENTDQNIVAILSDIMMPNLSGIELLKRARENDRFKTIPFVLITAVTEKEYIIEAKELKVNGYILKPVTSQRVKAKLQEIFPNRKFPQLAG